MVNLEHKLTVDDLIVEYMMYKVNNGYEPGFTTGEFINFLLYFETKMTVYDTLYDGEKLFNRFFDRKNGSDWKIIKSFRTMESKIIPHMNMIYSSKDTSYLIKANYKLSDFDSSVINTHFMSKTKSEEIRSIIGEWLSDYPKRKIDESIELNDQELMIGKYTAVEIITNIWTSYINKQIKEHRWPEQCTDINKYLFEIDLAEIINLKPIKKELIELYDVLSKRIAILYNQDKNLHISTYKNTYLARANYELIIQGYEKIMNSAFGNYKSSIDIDLSTLTFKESHELDGNYDWDEDPDIKTTTITIGNEKVKRLVRILDENISNKLIKCNRIGVDCVANDPVDIRCGGPEYLGFDFNVKEEETEEMKKFITITLETLEIPLVNLYVCGTEELKEKDVWDKKRIVEVIQREANYLKHEASRNYRKR